MFLSSLRAPLVAIVAGVAVVSSTSSVSALPSLSIKTSTLDLDIDGVGNLKVTTTIVNTGGETLKLLNDPRGVLDPFPENSFTFANPSGPLPSFKGARASYNSTLAASSDDPSLFTVLSPGGSVNVTHDLSAAYDFAQSGTGEYSVEPSNRFTYIDADGMPNDLNATIGNIAKVKLSGDLGVSRHVHNKRINIFNCGTNRKAALETAITTARDKIQEANEQVRHTRQSFVPRRYQLWFGGYRPDYYDDIALTIFNLHRDRLRFEYVCYTEPRRSITFDYPHIYYEHGYVHVNPSFFNRQLVSLEGRFELLVRVAALYEGATAEPSDIHRCQSLATNNPRAASLNANNIVYYIMNFEGLDVVYGDND